MRDPARIPGLLERLRAVWEANPDLRLGQIVVNGIGDDEWVYSTEDEELIAGVEAMHRPVDR